MRLLILTLLLTGSASLYSRPITFESLTIKQALEQAKAENKFVFVDFYADWCRPCKFMEQEVFTDQGVATLFDEHFIAIRIDAEREQLDYVNNLDIQAYPTLAFYDPKGRLVYREEGAMEADDFYALSESLVYLNDRMKAYDKNPNKKENAHDYLLSLAWINEVKAGKLARVYINELKEKEYEDPLNWELMTRFVKPWDRILVNRMASSEVIQETYPDELKSWMINALETLLEKAIEYERTAILRTRAQYIQSYAEMLPNPDSLRLFGEMQYAGSYDVANYSSLLDEYLTNYVEENAATYSEIAYYLSEKFFDRSVLLLGAELANRSVALKPNLKAYLALSSIHEKLLEYKAAYSYLLLALTHSNETVMEALLSKEQHLKRLMEIELHEGVTTENAGSDDGRFTLGAGAQRLMYGYPVPESTSHFVVNVNGALASNAPFSPNVTHIRGHSVYTGNGIAPTVITTYHFEDVTIIQTLEPVDKNGEEVNQGLAQYYKVSYELSTSKVRTKKVGLSILFDTMMDDNDFCTIATNGKIIPHEYLFRRSSMPDELLFYRTANDTSDLVGSALITKLDATPPDMMVVGRWPYLYRVKWEVYPKKVPYGDSAYMLRWANRSLNSRESHTFTTYYGLPNWKRPTLRLIMKDDDNILTSHSQIYFHTDSDELDLNAKMKIQELLENESIDITGVILQGYADVSGASDYNFELSKRRINAVGKIFKGLGIPFVPKPYGIDQSELSFYNEQFGNAFDRKVEIIIYYKLRAEEMEGL